MGYQVFPAVESKPFDYWVANLVNSASKLDVSGDAGIYLVSSPSAESYCEFYTSAGVKVGSARIVNTSAPVAVSDKFNYIVVGSGGSTAVEIKQLSKHTINTNARNTITSSGSVTLTGRAIVMCLGGGGGGGNNNPPNQQSGGGGGSGYVSYGILEAGTYSAVIGAGGAGLAGGQSWTNPAASGGATSIGGISANGGGGSKGYGNGGDGGSSGGSQNTAGGSNGSGGSGTSSGVLLNTIFGGYGAAGAAGNPGKAGGVYAGGGGGSTSVGSSNGESAAANSGGGGGGASWGSNGYSGGTGGSGRIVYIYI